MREPAAPLARLERENQRMSTVRKPQAPRPIANDADPFRYGWRDVIVRNPDGTTSFEQLPLTREDALHPEPGDYIVHTDPHADDMVYLKSVFKALLKRDSSAVVLADCGVDWRLRGVKHVCPDIAVFFDVDMKKWPRTEAIFYVKALHARTAFVIEVTSRSTRKNDLETKVGYYHRCRVPIYIVVDAMIEEGGQRKLKLIGYRFAQPGMNPSLQTSTVGSGSTTFVRGWALCMTRTPEWIASLALMPARKQRSATTVPLRKLTPGRLRRTLDQRIEPRRLKPRPQRLKPRPQRRSQAITPKPEAEASVG